MWGVPGAIRHPRKAYGHVLTPGIASPPVFFLQFFSGDSSLLEGNTLAVGRWACHGLDQAVRVDGISF